MTFKVGSRVRIRPLGKRGRVVGAQLAKRGHEVLYLVRYEIGEDEVDRRSRADLYVASELRRLAQPVQSAQAEANQPDEQPAEPSEQPLPP